MRMMENRAMIKTISLLMLLEMILIHLAFSLFIMRETDKKQVTFSELLLEAHNSYRRREHASDMQSLVS